MELFFLAVLIFLMATALGSGYPVAFALPGAAILSIAMAAGAGFIFAGETDAYFAQGGPEQWLSAGVINLRGVYWEVERDTLIAIPLFIFMGIMLQRSKIAEDLLVTMAQLFGSVPGGLGISVVFVGALLAATTGIVGATVVAMGLISLPAMLRNRYSQQLATGTIAASGTLGQIIPPSIVLIILADQLASATDQASTTRKALHKEATGELTMPSVFDVTSTSAGEMFLGAFVPGLVLVALYMAYILIFAFIRPSQAPSVPYEGRFDGRFWGHVCLILIPPLALIFLVLGSIIAGIATVNQAGAIGATGALIMAGYRLTGRSFWTYLPAILSIVALAVIAYALANYDMNVKRINSPEDVTGITLGALGSIMLVAALVWSGLRVFKIDNTLNEVMIDTAKTTSLVFIILLGAAMLTAAFRAFGGEELVREYLNALPGGFWSQFITVMLVIFILGFFLDFIEIAVVVVPIVAPILLADPAANITAVWLGVMIGLNIQTSFLTPPFGFALFYLRGVAPPVVRTVQMYKGVIAFICLQLLALGIVGAYPQLVNYLPNRVSLTSTTAPPPRNPKLQHCLEEYVSEKLEANGPAISAAIADLRSADLDALPERMAEGLRGALDDAEAATEALADAEAAQEIVDEAAVDYRPVLRKVRNIERDANRIEEHIAENRSLAGRLHSEENAARKSELEAEIASLEAEKARLLAEIPESWEEEHRVFAELVRTEDRARLTYRRAADGAYLPAMEVLGVLNANDAFFALESDLRALRPVLETAPAAEAEAAADDLVNRVIEIEGALDIRSALSDARGAISGDAPDRESALADLDEAIAAYERQLDWRRRAANEVLPALEAYEATIRDTLGARQQDRLSEEQAVHIAACTASHRDISLHF